jgi:hypothetical protein
LRNTAPTVAVVILITEQAQTTKQKPHDYATGITTTEHAATHAATAYNVFIKCSHIFTPLKLAQHAL